MLRRAGIVTLAAIVLAAAVTALATASGRSSDHRGTEVIELSFKAATGTDVDVAEKGFSTGDRFMFVDDVFRDDERVGVLGGDCGFLAVDEESFDVTAQCVVTLSLPDGQITAQGLIDFTDDEVQRFTVAVTGGTGDYRRARGEARVEERPDEGVGEVKVTLVR